MDTLAGYFTHLKASVTDRLSGLHQRVGDSSLDFWTDDRFGSPTDTIRRRNEALSTDLEAAQREHRKLRHVVEQLSRDYEHAKDLDPIRRYQRLKNMAKRTILHLRLEPDSKKSSITGEGLFNSHMGLSGSVPARRHSTPVNSLSYRRRSDDRCSRMTRQAVNEDNARKTQQLRDVRRKCSIVRDQVLQLEAAYHRSKRYLPPHRYRLLKDMLKRVIHDDLSR